jgi:hypothetical protein
MLSLLATNLYAQNSNAVFEKWYGVYSSDQKPFGTYRDRVERRGGKIYFTNSYWRREEGSLLEEQLVAIAEEDLTPDFFNLTRIFRKHTKKIDGKIDRSTQGLQLQVKILEGSNPKPAIRRSLPDSTIFSSHFPLWISKKWKELKVGKPLSFQTLMEDQASPNFAPVSGRAVWELDQIEKTPNPELRTFRIQYQDRKILWRLKATGETVRIEMPESGILVVPVSIQEARRILESIGGSFPAS